MGAHNTTPIRDTILDLCSGTGAWLDAFALRGWQTLALDIARHPDNHHPLILADITTWHPGDLAHTLGGIVASPPCTPYSQVWAYSRNPRPDPAPYDAILAACHRIFRECPNVPWILENVRDAQKALGPARAHAGPWYLWGAVPAILPYRGIGKNIPTRTRGHYNRKPDDRARIPPTLADWIAQTWPTKPPQNQ